MSDYLLLLETGEELLQETGDELGIDGIGYILVQKSLTYNITGAIGKKTKTLKYCTRAPPAAKTKSLTYKITDFLLQENGDFLLQENGDKIILETPTTEKSKTKSLKYCVYVSGSPRVCYGDHPAYGDHVCYGPVNNISKALKYTVQTTKTAITKDLTYSIRFFVEAITHDLKYTILTTPSAIQKSLTYKKADFLLQENGDYLLQENGDRLIIEYSTTEKLITKSLKYTINILGTISIGLTYRIITPNWDPESKQHTNWDPESKVHTDWDDTSLAHDSWDEQSIP